MYYLLAGSSYMEVAKEVEPPKKELINIQSINHNEPFKWC